MACCLMCRGNVFYHYCRSCCACGSRRTSMPESPSCDYGQLLLLTAFLCHGCGTKAFSKNNSSDYDNDTGLGESDDQIQKQLRRLQTQRQAATALVQPRQLRLPCQWSTANFEQFNGFVLVSKVIVSAYAHQYHISVGVKV